MTVAARDPQVATCRRWMEAFRQSIAVSLRLARSNRGIAAVEFALILPVIVILYVGAAEVSDAVMTSRKLDAATRTLVDLLSHQSTTAQPGPNPTSSSPAPQNAVTTTTLSQIMSAATTAMYPEPTAPLQMTLSAIDVSNASNGVCCALAVRWTYTQNGTLRPCGNNVMTATAPTSAQSSKTFSSALLPYGTPLPGPLSFIIVDVGYAYQPVMGSQILKVAPAMSRTEYMMPRATGQVIAAGLTAPSNGTGGVICF